MIEIAIEDAGCRLNDLIEAAAGGEDVVITRGDLPAARIVLVPTPTPAERPQPKFGSAKGKILFMADDFDAPLQCPPSADRPLFGSAKGLIEIADDFDEPLEEFREYTGSGACSIPTSSSGSSPAIRGSVPAPASLSSLATERRC